MYKRQAGNCSVDVKYSLVAEATEIEESSRVFGVLSNKRTRIQGGNFERLGDCLLQWFQHHRVEGPLSAGQWYAKKQMNWQTDSTPKTSMRRRAAYRAWLQQQNRV